ncbi:MAG: DNA-directed RNA polymerase subunit omega [Chthonomonadales bacterium]
MIYPHADKLDAMESRYALVIVAAKRARQIKEGARTFVKSRSKNPLTVALEEIAQGAIIPVSTGEPEPVPTLEPTPVVGGLAATADLAKSPAALSREDVEAMLPVGDTLDADQDFLDASEDQVDEDTEPDEPDLYEALASADAPLSTLAGSAEELDDSSHILNTSSLDDDD